MPNGLLHTQWPSIIAEMMTARISFTALPRKRRKFGE